jgi:hypothetical protein
MSQPCRINAGIIGSGKVYGFWGSRPAGRGGQGILEPSVSSSGRPG